MDISDPPRTEGKHPDGEYIAGVDDDGSEASRKSHGGYMVPVPEGSVSELKVHRISSVPATGSSRPNLRHSIEPVNKSFDDWALLENGGVTPCESQRNNF